MPKHTVCIACRRALKLSPHGVCRGCIELNMEQDEYDELVESTVDEEGCCVCGGALAEPGKMIYCGPRCEDLDARVSQQILLHAVSVERYRIEGSSFSH